MEKEYQFGTIEQAIADIKAGKMVLVTDDPDRENEGDLIMAADFVTPEAINFMATHAKGLICAPCDGKILDRLQLEPMVANNTDNHETAFTVSIDHVDTTTGISAAERAYTIKKLTDPKALPADFRRPGHVFPCAVSLAASCAVRGTQKPRRTCAALPVLPQPESAAKS